MSSPRAILVVDDNPVDREIHGQIVRRLGYELHVARDGFEAIEIYRQRRPEIVLLDIEMPVMDGLATARQLHELDCPEAPEGCVIIAVSSLQAPAGGAVGIDAWLAKPLDEPALRAAIARLLDTGS